MELLDKNNLQMIDEYERFNMEYGCFMQSLQWAGVKSNWSWEAVISRGGEGEIRAVCLVLVRKIPFSGSAFMYAPRGPVFSRVDTAAAKDIFEGVRLIAKRYNAYRLMCDPLFEEDISDLKSLGFAHNVNASDGETVQPRANYILKNIGGKTEDELIAGFKPDHRNRVRKAGRKGVYCKICGVEAVDDFYSLMRQTGRRDNISIRSKEYFERFLNSFPREQCRLFMCYAEIDGRETPLSGAIAVRYGKTATYVYGASSDYHRNLYPNYLMQMEMMKWAVAGGCEIYDFGGIPHYDDETSPAYGLYRFKKGFNGEIVVYSGEYTFDFRPAFAKLADFCSGILFVRNEHEHHKIRKNAKRLKA